jgi:chromosome segregation ATPase
MKRLLVIIAASWMGAAGAAYKCTDAKGITHVGDTPPPGCKDVMMYEVTPAGKVLREIEPTLTPEQAKVRAAELEKKRAADALVAEQKRKDLALLATYASEKEFDVARDRNIEPIKSKIASSQEQIKQAEKRQKEIQEEMEFYKAGKSKKGGEIPPRLTDGLKRVESEKSTLEASIAASEKEIEEVKAKYDADKKRWVELKSGPKKN